MSTYLSRDGGYNWEKIADGAYMYEIADHGGLIVITKSDGLTKELKYTFDEGLTWNTIDFYE